jgi:hypothetical protein
MDRVLHIGFLGLEVVHKNAHFKRVETMKPISLLVVIVGGVYTRGRFKV